MYYNKQWLKTFLTLYYSSLSRKSITKSISLLYSQCKEKVHDKYIFCSWELLFSETNYRLGVSLNTKIISSYQRTMTADFFSHNLDFLLTTFAFISHSLFVEFLHWVALKPCIRWILVKRKRKTRIQTDWEWASNSTCKNLFVTENAVPMRSMFKFVSSQYNQHTKKVIQCIEDHG